MEHVANTHVTKHGHTFYLLLPRNVMEVLGWDAKTKVKIEKSGESLVFTKVGI